MNNYIGCKHANWNRTAKGNLHPSGDGRCEFPYEPSPLPASMYWIGFSIRGGGYINRRGERTKSCPTREAKL